MPQMHSMVGRLEAEGGAPRVLGFLSGFVLLLLLFLSPKQNKRKSLSGPESQTLGGVLGTIPSTAKLIVAGLEALLLGKQATEKETRVCEQDDAIHDSQR